MQFRSTLRRRRTPNGAQRLVLAVLLHSLLAVACDGSSDQDEDGGPIRGNERLGWNQTASSLQELRSLTFTLYVDNSRSSLINVRCGDTSTSGAFECSGGLPSMSAGRHVLELASTLNGTESPRSERLVVTVSGSTQIGAPSASEVSSASPAAEAQGCAAAGEACIDNRVLSTELESFTAVAATPEGSVFIGDDEGRIRVIAAGGLLPTDALRLPAGSRIAGLAVDSRFGQTRSVFVAWTETYRGVSTLNVTRYRELQNILGEGATIATGMPFPDGASAPMTVDGDGLVYIALPSTSPGPDVAGSVLRIDRDGAVPQQNHQASRVVAGGYSTPVAIAVDSSRRVWLAGKDTTGSALVAGVDVSSHARPSWQPQPTPRLTGAIEGLGSIVSLVSTSGRLVIATSDGLFQSFVSADAMPSAVEKINLGGEATILAAAADSAGVVHVITKSTPGGSPSYLRVKLR
jgi:hypothetical protein